MIDTAEQTTTTACLACGSPIIQIAGRGHRKRLYCDDRCRQRAHRQRQVPQDTASVINDVMFDDISIAHILQAEKRIADLEQELAEANALIEQLLDKKQTRQPLKRSFQDRLMRWGEKLGWPALDIHYGVKPGRKEWRVFMINGSNTLLIQAIIAAEQLEESKSNIT